MRKYLPILLTGLLVGCTATNTSSPTSFYECLDAGFPAMESYPRRCKTDSGETFTEQIGEERQVSDFIHVSNPEPDASISRRIFLEGEARGSWYFEATFPVTLVDANENMLVETYAEADGEWMTDSFVPFRMEFDIPEPTTRTGVLILKNANASGLPDRAMELRIPLKFHLRNDSPQHITFFFYSEKDLEDAFVSSPVEITRLTDAHLDPIDAILRAMFSEPREHEYAQGARSSEDLYALDEYYLGVSIENRIATIDFADNALSILNSTATRQLMAKDLVEHTLKSQPSIDSVQYSIEGEVWTEWDA
jgi:hypothetical protein